MKITIDTSNLPIPSGKSIYCTMKWGGVEGVYEPENRNDIEFSTDPRNLDPLNDECVCIVIPIKIPIGVQKETHRDVTVEDLKK